MTKLVKGLTAWVLTTIYSGPEFAIWSSERFVWGKIIAKNKLVKSCSSIIKPGCVPAGEEEAEAQEQGKRAHSHQAGRYSFHYLARASAIQPKQSPFQPKSTINPRWKLTVSSTSLSHQPYLMIQRLRWTRIPRCVASSGAMWYFERDTFGNMRDGKQQQCHPHVMPNCVLWSWKICLIQPLVQLFLPLFQVYFTVLSLQALTSIVTPLMCPYETVSTWF